MKLSIITINYNHLKGLQKTINSVINQSFNDFEYIVIDGASTDGSADFIKEHADQIDYWVSEPDTGIYNAMNKGIRKATGEYLIFMNSGDCFVDQFVLYNIFDNREYTSELIRGNMIIGNEISTNHGKQNVTLRSIYDGYIRHQSTFIHRKAFDKYGLYDETYKASSDWKLFLTMFYHGTSTVYVDVDVALFELGGISTNANTADLLIEERQRILQEVLPETIRADYEKLIDLEEKVNFSQHYYISNFVVAHKFPQFIFKVLHKIYTILGI